MKAGAFKRITVAVDGSPASEAGVRCALSLAGDDTTLFFCRVVDPASAVRDIPIKAPLSPAELNAAARAACEDGVREANARGVSANSVVVEEHPARGILRCAHEHQSDAIVMGSHGRTGIARAVVGSTAEEVIRLSDVPVGVAHADDMLRAGPIAVAIDASDAADAALTIGIALARAVPCELHLFHVFGRADLKHIDALGQDHAERVKHASLEAAAVLEEAADRARSSGVAFESSMLEGNPAQELLKAFDRHQCASAVVGTHGASELDRLLFGSVAFALVERARVPIFVVRQAERATSKESS
jgi:nucleotide-binding universal stress UspA family protein